MKKLIIALVCLLAPLGARAQLVAVTGNVKDAGATNATGSNTYVRFSLINYGPTIPRVIGTNVIANPVKDFHPDGFGNISGTLQGNDTITPNGTDYQVCIFYQGNQFRCATYLIIGPTFNLNTAIPINSPPPSNQLIYGTKTYVFVQASPSLSWVIPHHFGDKNVQVQCRDLTDHVLFPDTIVLTDQNTVTVNFIIPQAGTCIVISGGNAVFTTVIGDAVIKNPNANQNMIGFLFTHNGNPFTDTGTAYTWDQTQTFSQDVNVLGTLNWSTGLPDNVVPYVSSLLPGNLGSTFWLYTPISHTFISHDPLAEVVMDDLNLHNPAQAVTTMTPGAVVSPSLTASVGLTINHVLISATAPTISSGFGTGAAILTSNGTATFRINVGTGGSATNGVIGLPAVVPGGWNCRAQNLTAHAGHRADDTVFISSTTTTATIENQTKSTGAAVAWTASDTIEVQCPGY